MPAQSCRKTAYRIPHSNKTSIGLTTRNEHNCSPKTWLDDDWSLRLHRSSSSTYPCFIWWFFPLPGLISGKDNPELDVPIYCLRPMTLPMNLRFGGQHSQISCRFPTNPLKWPWFPPLFPALFRCRRPMALKGFQCAKDLTQTIVIPNLSCFLTRECEGDSSSFSQKSIYVQNMRDLSIYLSIHLSIYLSMHTYMVAGSLPGSNLALFCAEPFCAKCLSESKPNP